MAVIVEEDVYRLLQALAVGNQTCAYSKFSTNMNINTETVATSAQYTYLSELLGNNPLIHN